jgi:hypothetical protein
MPWALLLILLGNFSPHFCGEKSNYSPQKCGERGVFAPQGAGKLFRLNYLICIIQFK